MAVFPASDNVSGSVNCFFTIRFVTRFASRTVACFAFPAAVFANAETVMCSNSATSYASCSFVISAMPSKIVTILL